MSCVKYCVFTLPLGFTAVQTHGGGIKRASTYPRPDEERGGDLYRSERSERRSDSDSPNQVGTLRNDDGQIFVGWVGGTPECFFICAVSTGSLSYSVQLGHSAFRCRLAFFCLRGVPCVFAVLGSLCTALPVYSFNIAYLFISFYLIYLLSVLDNI